uniref:non-specific serine/threonine protein kinase n=1 Tax=Quercus lobata TaxID=97700 RepID=A0A7N2MAQ5_QUELO
MNNLSGPIPASIGNLSNLSGLYLWENNLCGSIPSSIGNLSNLANLDLSENKLSGSICHEIGMLGSLSYLGNLSNLSVLYLYNNTFSGPIPEEIGKLGFLSELSLYMNNLSGPIPTSIGNLSNLSVLYLSDNALSGPIPEEIGKFGFLSDLRLHMNNLTGSIPASIGNLTKLTVLEISGVIPPQLGGSTQLHFLDLSFNHIVGQIPKELGRLTSLLLLNLGDNKLSGRMFLSLIVFGILYHVLKRQGKRNKLNSLREAQNGNMFEVWSYDGKMVYESIIEATEGFDSKHCVGVGGCGSVYKAVLQTGQVVAVKKFHSIQDNRIANAKAFENEIHALLEIRHHNVVKLYGFCSHPRHSFLVYEFLEGGSLKEILSNKKEVVNFEWVKRVNVVKGVVDALSYMHHDCSPRIVHRDISSKNIMLDLEYKAHISDFGTAKFLNPDSLNQTSFAGTFGYTAPSNSFVPFPNFSLLACIFFLKYLPQVHVIMCQSKCIVVVKLNE